MLLKLVCIATLVVSFFPAIIPHARAADDRDMGIGGAIGDHRPWTGVVVANGAAGVTFIYSRTAPRLGALSDAQFAVGERMTVIGTVTGDALDGSNVAWYRVVTGAYRPAYIYSSYLQFVHAGKGPAPQPLVSAAASVALDLDTGSYIYSSNATVSRAPASLVKLMTAALALDHLSLDTVVTVPVGAPSVGVEIGGSAMGLSPGERLAVRDLLYGLLLPSGNDAAYTLAQAVGGSQDGFAAMMNAKAQALGMTGTHFVQSYGIDAPDEYTTAADMARLVRYDLLHYPFLRRVVRTDHHTIGRGAAHGAYDLYSTNRLLGVYPGIFGVKTGTTPNAGQNLVAAATRYNHRLVVVVLGSSDRYADATALLNYAGLAAPKKR